MTYYKGERYEAVWLVIFGLLLFLISLLIGRNMSTNEMLKGLFYPLVLLTAVSIFAGGYNVWNNQKRLENLPAKHAQDHKLFVKEEIQRFEGANGVNKWWLPLKIVWSIFLIVGLVVTFLTKSDFIQGIAIGLIIWGCFGMVVDGFAHQRAKIYTSQLFLQ